MNILFVILGIICFAIITMNTKKKKLSERESIIWIVGSVILIILPFFTKQIDNISLILGINYPPSLLFTLGIIFCLLLIFRLTRQNVVLSYQVQDMAEQIAVLDKEIRELKKQIKDK